MMKSLFFVLVALLLVSGGIGLYFYQLKPDLSYPRYSSFAVVDESLAALASDQAVVPELVYNLVSAPSTYPVNELKDEINRLVDLSKQRTESLIEEHEREYADVLAIEVEAGKTLRDYLGVDTRPLTNEIYRIFSNDIDIIVANQKIQNDVARPKQIDLRVNTQVETPATPAYPSLFAAKATVAGEILAYFMKPEDYSIVSRAIEEAIIRKQIVGVSTKFDTDYGRLLAEEYSEIVLNHERSAEFLNLVKEKEWTNEKPWQPVNAGKILASLKPSGVTVVKENNSFIFKSNIENSGLARTPERFTITLEIDRYNDGSVDRTVDFAYGAILPGEIKEAAYILGVDWRGTHSARFVVNKNLDFLEEYHYDNYGEWTEFAVD